jgi:general secretion pathway protein G
MKRSRYRQGFTLMEVMVVLFILILLSGVVGVSVVQQQRRARRDTAILQIRQLRQAVQIYYNEQGRVPTTEQGLEALVGRPTRPPVPAQYPPEGYLDSRRVPADPWGNPYIYLAPGRAGELFEIITYGSDGEPGGSDYAADISSSDL